MFYQFNQFSIFRLPDRKKCILQFIRSSLNIVNTAVFGYYVFGKYVYGVYKLDKNIQNLVSRNYL